MITPRRRKQRECEESYLENPSIPTISNKYFEQPPPTPLKSPNNRSRRRPRYIGKGYGRIPSLLSPISGTTLRFDDSEEFKENNSPRDNSTSSIFQQAYTPLLNDWSPSQNCMETTGNSKEAHLVPDCNSQNTGWPLQESYVDSDYSKPPLFPSSNSGIANSDSCTEDERKYLHDIDQGTEAEQKQATEQWLSINDANLLLCSPVTDRKMISKDSRTEEFYYENLTEMWTPKSSENSYACTSCLNKAKDIYTKSVPSVRRCSLCSPMMNLTPLPCNVNPFSPEVRTQGFITSPQQDTDVENLEYATQHSDIISRNLDFDSSSLLASHVETIALDESENEEEDYCNFDMLPILSVPKLSRYKDDFEEIEEIGSGTFGKVFKCRKRLDGWLYAVKSVHRKIRSHVEKQNVLKEVYALAAMTDNPHVVRYFNAWIEDDILYIQTELCEEGSVMSLWRNGKLHFDNEAMRRFIYQVALGLAIYHDKGLVHLDIKPENIYITSDDVYKIGDLGLTASSESEIISGYNLDLSEGDSRYIAPELLEENYDNLTKADIFSLGATAYELCRLSKLPLLSGGDEWHQIRRGELEAMTINGEMETLIRDMLNPNPLLRPTAKEVVNRVSSQESKELVIRHLEQTLKEERNKRKHLEALLASSS
eukprot:jgi/Galph1/2980/GphlegSOOS_G1621.1